jgi:hypothetical protein
VLQTHVEVDVVASKPGVAAIHIKSPLIHTLPFQNEASSLIQLGVTVMNFVHSSKILPDQSSPTAAHV